METWLNDHFVHGPPSVVIVYQQGNTALVYDPVNAAMDFPSVAPVPTHAVLSSLTIAAQGWQKIFDQWKTNGLIT